MNSIEELSINIGNVLLKNNMKISVAESCTGGLIGGALTDVAGSSRYFRGGVIAYDNEIKSQLLSVPDHVLKEYGAVSDETVIVMAQGVCKLFNTECSISVSGIAGPGGGTVLKPVGLVHVGIVIKDKANSYKYNFPGTRKEIRISTVGAALNRFLHLVSLPATDTF